ncbi:MAG: fumarylacetoacetate hydrolase family protein [Alphaproteobacteria bacterium]|nr:fumarylacetoacetate hydrolase family protein [Alphaproteobacteria bacterium]
MRICWFDDNRLGVVRKSLVHDVSSVLSSLSLIYPYPEGDPLIANLGRFRPAMESAADEVDGRPLSEVKLLSPVANPSKIIGTPVNYRKHVAEAHADPDIDMTRFAGSVIDQGLFLKATSSLVGPSQGVAVRFPDRRTDHECELGVIIGKTADGIDEKDALDYVAGYAIALDMTVRGSEDRSFRKSVESYAVLGPWLVTADEIADPDALDFELSVVGEVRQKSNTDQMILSVAKQVSWASSFYTLHPGDIIMTGTCEGVAPVKPGDTMTCTFEGIGEMEVPVRAAG